MKKRTLNELRQTKEFYVAKQKVLSDVGFDTNEEMKQIAACVKEIEEIDPVQKVLAQQIDEELEEGIKEMVDKHQEDLDKASAEGSKKFWPITTHEFRPQEIEKIQKDLNKGYKDIADDLDLIESAKELITNKILKHFDDVLFEMVCQEMGDNYLFQSRNYLTEAGYELFEDEWFEFYHEHHGDILYRVKHGLFE